MKQKKLWKKYILIFTIIFFIVTGGVVKFSLKNLKDSKPTKWEAYSSGDERFDVQFPSEPKESSEEMDIDNKKIQFNELSTESGDSVYAVSYVDFPGHWKLLGSKKLLTKAFDSYLENQKNVDEVLDQGISSHHGIPALDYHFKQAGKEVKGKFIIAGNTLYRITVTYPLAAAEKIKPEAFFDSFQIKT